MFVFLVHKYHLFTFCLLCMYFVIALQFKDLFLYNEIVLMKGADWGIQLTNKTCI